MRADTVNLAVLRRMCPWQTIAMAASGLGLVTWLGFVCATTLHLSVLGLLYLLPVLWVAYRKSFAAAMLTAFAAFLLINYCFIEPRYTLRVDHAQSWLMLLVFALVAFTVSRVMLQLKQQTLQAERAARQARFFQTLAELLAAQSSGQTLLQAACEHVKQCLGVDVRVMRYIEPAALSSLAATSASLSEVQVSSVQWALDYQRAIGAGTMDWPALVHCILPFGPTQQEVLIIEASEEMPAPDVSRLLVLQMAQAYLNLMQRIALAQAARAASEANFKKTLLTALSHDMRTPLTAILGAVNVLADRQITLPPAQSGALLHSIQAEASYLTQATENILTLVKLEAGASSLHLDWESPQEVMQHVAHRYLQRTPAVPLQLSLPPADSQHEMLFHVDAVLVAHALANLIDNALHWREADSVIELSLHIEPPWLVLSVLNQGPGFPPGFVISSFEAHKPVAAGGRGFGLGLSIVETVMQLQGGQVQLTRVTDNRTCVCLLFPFVQAADLMVPEA